VPWALHVVIKRKFFTFICVMFILGVTMNVSKVCVLVNRTMNASVILAGLLMIAPLTAVVTITVLVCWAHINVTSVVIGRLDCHVTAACPAAMAARWTHLLVSFQLNIAVEWHCAQICDDVQI